jgi:hypothetical protein
MDKVIPGVDQAVEVSECLGCMVDWLPGEAIAVDRRKSQLHINLLASQPVNNSVLP